jgi:TIR domain
MSHDVFISFAPGDRELAAFLARRLDERGVSTWYDAVLAAGTSAQADVDKALGEARLVALLFSEDCNRSDRIPGEATLADSLGKPVVPFLIEPAQPRGGCLHILADRPWIQAHPG